MKLISISEIVKFPGPNNYPPMPTRAFGYCWCKAISGRMFNEVPVFSFFSADNESIVMFFFGPNFPFLGYVWVYTPWGFVSVYPLGAL